MSVFRLRKTSGFSLLEVVLAISILSTLAVLSTQAISRALNARTKIQAEVDDVSALRDSMRLIRTDLNLAYHHRDFEQEIIDLVNKPSTKAGGTPPTGSPPPPPDPSAGSAADSNPSTGKKKREAQRMDPSTHFVGDNEQLNFVTMNNGRMLASSPQADFIEVGYALKDCKNLTTGAPSKCLFRRTQTILDDDVTQGGNEAVMLENVTEFKLRYWGADKTDWLNNWKSTKESLDDSTKNRYPDSVEVSLSIERAFAQKKRTYALQFIVPIHFPNNPDKNSSKDNKSNNGQPNNPVRDAEKPVF